MFGSHSLILQGDIFQDIIDDILINVTIYQVSSWIRLRQRLRRQRLLTLSLKSEQQANAYEIAAWADEPSTVPARSVGIREDKEKKSKKERKEELRAWKRGGANAFALQEWEGVAA